MNKQKQLNPRVVSKSVVEHQVDLVLNISEDVSYFEGHFPGTPILAGVVQLDWAVEFALREFNLSSDAVKEVQVLKFQHVIRPNSQVTLTLQYLANNKFTFTYRSEQGVHASGRVLMEAC